MRNKSEERKKSNNPGFKKALIEVHGDRCVNCGSDENIEFHHIVPLAIGGTNNYGNVVPLCWKCHKAIHSGITIDDLKSKKPNGGGRKRKNDDKQFREVFNRYINGEIGNAKAGELVGVSKQCRFTEMIQYKELLKELGISRIKNTIDVANSIAKEGLFDGRIVGEIIYKDGRRSLIRFRDTGEYERIEEVSEGNELCFMSCVEDSDIRKDTIKLYVSGAIGECECKRALGIPLSMKLESSREFREYLDEYGIMSVVNNIDNIAINVGLDIGSVVGNVIYYNGKTELILYNPALLRLVVR